MTSVDFNILKDIFEPELLEKVMSFPMLEIPENFSSEGHEAKQNAGDIHIVIQGQVSLFQKDTLGNQVKIYDVRPGESCIVGLNSSLNSKGTFNKTFFKAVKKSKSIVIPKEYSKLWFDEYKTWRQFVLNLYSERLSELLIQHNAVSEQNVAIEGQNKKITDSINYAKRIQQAVFPTEIHFKNAAWDYFILFKPRDIVSGDFYWITEEQNLMIIAAADATGHGVPGAFMSLLGIAYLNEIKELIAEKKLTPNLILDELRARIKYSLKQKGENNEAKDGMDIALCSIDMDTNKLIYSGAHNPLYVFKKNSEFIELKSDRQPIGIHLKEKPFTKQEIQLEKGDVFYMFSDGYIDQFGGSEGSKFKSRQFKEFLKSIHSQDMTSQKNLLDKKFYEWKGDLEQVDDILIIGVRI